jgi:ubiquinol-cytochrome c reductase cytochrome c1 subunit
MRTKILVLLAVLMPAMALAVGEARLDHVAIDVGNKPALQRGARNFVNYCLGCHSAKYVRYNRVAADLGIPEQLMIDNLMFTGVRLDDTMRIGINPDDAKRWFGVVPPDLSLMARARGTDYIYTFLRSFYADPSRPTGVNNTVLPGTAMPHVLWQLQGVQDAVWEGQVDAQGNALKEFKEFRLATPGTMTPEDFDGFVRDTVTFLDYIGEPVKQKRESLGFPVIAFLLFFTLLAWALKKEYWKDVK